MYPNHNLPLTTPLSFADNFNTGVIGASVGSAAAVLLLAIIVVLIIVTCMTVLKPQKKGKVFNSDFSIISGELQSCNYLLSQK